MAMKCAGIFFVAVLSAALSACSREPAPAAPASGAPATLGSAAAAPTEPVALTQIVPAPARVQAAADPAPVALDATAPVQACGGVAENVARHFTELLQRTRGFALRAQCQATAPAAGIEFRQDAQLADLAAEAYVLEAGNGRVLARARSEAGLFYGAVSLWQLLTVDAPGTPVSRIAAGRIDDTPRYSWRGLMLDSARHFQSPEFIKKMIDAMALHKLNTLHWHLTDDQGWRIEIKKYPLLTEVGAWRVPAGPAAAADIDPATGKPRVYGGYYTQEQIREIVQYAAARHITIVPEIDMPGHAQAAIAAYPVLGTGEKPPVSAEWGVHTYLLNVEESTFTFIDDVLDEVVALFPSPYIHIGGDEAAKDRWIASPQVQARRKALGLKDEVALQAWFVARLETSLERHNRKLIGWDEILEGGQLPASASVMSWRGTKGAIEAARAGHDVVLSPSPDLYINNLQSTSADEPPGRYDMVVTLEKLYGFEPTPAELDAQQARHVLGAQVNLWTEHIRTTARVEHAVFPRLAALAEIDWTPREQRDWKGFLQRLPAQLNRYRQLGIGYAESAFAVHATATPGASADAIGITLANQTGFGDIRYTSDGSEPQATSPRYTAALSLPRGSVLQAAAFAGTQRLSAPLRLPITDALLRTRNSGEFKPCRENGLVLRLEDDAPLDGERKAYSVDIFDACWLWPQVDLAQSKAIEVDVANLPYNFQLWHDIKNVKLRPAASAEGELEIRRGSCDGKPWLTLPLKPAVASHGITTLRAELPADAVGTQDLCFVFARPDTATLWTVAEVRL
jgi:hexosaminidase